MGAMPAVGSLGGVAVASAVTGLSAAGSSLYDGSMSGSGGMATTTAGPAVSTSRSGGPATTNQMPTAARAAANASHPIATPRHCGADDCDPSSV
jgi:hypothetical protein